MHFTMQNRVSTFITLLVHRSKHGHMDAGLTGHYYVRVWQRTNENSINAAMTPSTRSLRHHHYIPHDRNHHIKYPPKHSYDIVAIVMLATISACATATITSLVAVPNRISESESESDDSDSVLIRSRFFFFVFFFFDFFLSFFFFFFFFFFWLVLVPSMRV